MYETDARTPVGDFVSALALAGLHVEDVDGSSVNDVQKDKILSVIEQFIF